MTQDFSIRDKFKFDNTKEGLDVKDINRVAAIFEVPNSVMWFALKQLRLI